MAQRRVPAWLITGVLLGAVLLSAQLPTIRGQAGQSVQQPIYIEDSPAAQELGYQALELSKEGRFVDAAQKLQQVIDAYPHKLMPTGESSYTDALLWARGELLADARLLGAYRSLFGPAAERETALGMPTGDRDLDAEVLRGVLSRYTLTRAGLDAGLALGAYHLERAEGGDASGVLDELINHPDLPTLAGRYHLMRGVASLLTGDTSGYEAQRQALRDLPDAPRLAELESLTNRIHPPLRLQQKPENGAVPFGLPESLDAPLWNIDLMESLGQGVGQRLEVRNMPVDQAVLRILPACDRDRVFINLVDRVIAYDRASGWRLWEVTGQPGSQSAAGMIAPGRGMTTEPRGVYLNGGRAYALLGWMHPNQNVRPGSEQVVALVAMRTDDGKELWRVTPGGLDPTLSNAAFDGTPTGGGGRIYTLVKRVRVSGLHDLYLTSVRQTDGTLVWRRYLSSSSAQSNYNYGPMVRMTLHAGRVYVSDNRGTVIALDGRTGTVRWATILPDTGSAGPTNRRVARAFKDMPDPVLVEAGLLVPPINSGGAYRLMDADTGELLRELRDRGWREVEACYAAGPDIFAVSKDVSCFSGRTLELLWRKPLDAERDGRVRGRPAVDPRLRVGPIEATAEPQPSAGVVVFSTDRRLIALNLDSGRVLSDTPITSPGNIALAPGQVVVAATADLHAYTDWQVAHRHLRDLADQEPSDPRPGMAMARLALRTEHDNEVLEGIDLALGSLTTDLPDPDANTARQREVFGLLRDFTDPVNGANVTLRGGLLDRMAASTAGPGQEATYQLTRGHYLVERDEPRRAVEHYQAVLIDRTLSSELYTVGRGSRRAGLEARRRLRNLIRAHGREVYQSYDLLAEHELNELTARSERDARPYVDLADRYPLALCVNEVRQYAADRNLEAGDFTSALRQLQAVYLDTVSDDGLAQIAGRIVQVYLANDRPELARRWLRRVKREHPGLILIRSDQPVHVQSWLSELRHILSASRRLPRIELPLQTPEWIDGRPMPTGTGVIGAASPSDRVLMTDGALIWMLTSPGLVERWRVPLPAEDARVLAMDDRQVVWWSKQTHQIGALDSRNGEPIWETIDYQDALNNAGDPRLQLERRTLQQRQFVQILGGAAVRNPRLNAGLASQDELLTAIDLTTIMLADRIGRAVCIDRDTGQIRWRTLGPADSLTSITLGDGLVAMGGASWVDTAAQHGIISLLDTLTGEPLETEIQSETVPVWMGFADNGLLVTAMPGNLVSYDPATGRTEWRSDLPIQAGVNRFDLGGHLLIVSEHRGQVGAAQVIDTDSGEVVNQLPIRASTGRPMLFDAIQAQGQWQVLTPMRAVALNPSGLTRWSDAICAPVGHMLMQRVGQRHVLIVGGSRPIQAVDLPPIQIEGRPEMEQALREIVEAARQQNAAVGYRFYLLDRDTGSIVSEVSLGDIRAPIDPDTGVLIDGALLLGVGNRTLVIKGQTPAD